MDVCHNQNVIWSAWTAVFLLKAWSNFFSLKNMLQSINEKSVIGLVRLKDYVFSFFVQGKKNIPFYLYLYSVC